MSLSTKRLRLGPGVTSSSFTKSKSMQKMKKTEFGSWTHLDPSPTHHVAWGICNKVDNNS